MAPMTASDAGGTARDPQAAALRIASRQVHRMLALLFGGVAALVVVVSLSGAGWHWTGFDQNPHLWDWLHLLVLPTVLTLLPLWVKTHVSRAGAWRLAMAAAAALLAVLVVGGYLLGWEWTGFAGNTLWDWLELLVLPLSVSLLPLWLSAERRLGSRHLALVVLGAGAFAVLVVCGYLIPWLWTGFRGNTLWDWIGLLLVPFAIPAAVTVLNVQATRQVRSTAGSPDAGA